MPTIRARVVGYVLSSILPTGCLANISTRTRSATSVRFAVHGIGDFLETDVGRCALWARDGRPGTILTIRTILLATCLLRTRDLCVPRLLSRRGTVLTWARSIAL